MRSGAVRTASAQLRKAARARTGVRMRLYVCVYANLRYAETKGWESEEKCIGSAARRTRGTVVPSLIPSRLPLPLPCSSVCRERMRQVGC